MDHLLLLEYQPEKQIIDSHKTDLDLTESQSWYPIYICMISDISNMAGNYDLGFNL